MSYQVHPLYLFHARRETTKALAAAKGIGFGQAWLQAKQGLHSDDLAALTLHAHSISPKASVDLPASLLVQLIGASTPAELLANPELKAIHDKICEEQGAEAGGTFLQNLLAFLSSPTFLNVILPLILSLFGVHLPPIPIPVPVPVPTSETAQLAA